MDEKNSIDYIVNEWCNVISEDIAQRTFYNKDEIAAYAKVKLKDAMDAALQIQCVNVNKRRQELAAMYADPDTPPYAKMKAAKELIELKEKRSRLNEYVQNQEDIINYRKLKLYVKETYGVEVLTNFYDNIAIHKNKV